MKRWLLLPLALLALSPADATAQEGDDSAPTWWVVFSEQVPSHNVAAYEAVAAEWRDMVAGHLPDGMVYYTLTGPEAGFVYAVPLGDLAQFAEMGRQWESMIEEIGRERFEEVDGRSSELVSHATTNFYVERHDLSYAPEGHDAAAAEMPMRHIDRLYVLPGKQAKFEEIMREWVEMYRQHGVERGWVTQQAITGEDLPLYVLLTPAEGLAEWAAWGEQLEAEFGDAYGDLLGRSMALMRDYESEDVWFRPELSELPAQE